MDGIRQFELLGDLRPGKSALAMLLKWNGRAYVPSDEKIVVYEFVNSHGGKGDRGYATFSRESGRWEVISGLFEQVPGWLPH